MPLLSHESSQYHRPEQTRGINSKKKSLSLSTEALLQKVAMAVRSHSTACDDGKIRTNEYRGKFICTMLSAVEFG